MCRYKTLLYISTLLPLTTFAFQNPKVVINPANISIPQLNAPFAFDSYKDTHKPLNSFYIQKYEVTKNNFLIFATSYAKNKKHIEDLKSSLWLEKYEYYDEEESLLPVTKVSYDMATKYCHSIGGRLPTQQEWIVAAITPTKEGKYQKSPEKFLSFPTITYPFEPTHYVITNSEEQGRFSDDFLNSVDLSLESANGLKGMLGNVWEMTSSFYQNQDDKIIIKGGSYQNSQTPLFYDVRFTNYININTTSHEYEHIGFRCVFNK